MPSPIRYEAPRPPAAPGETVVTSTCGHNCGGRCVVNAHVRDGRIVKISTDPRKWTPEDAPLHACVRGFGQLERLNHPDRITHPLRRVGPRGAGRFERIGWDEALDEVARQMLRIREAYGPAAILDCSRTGSLSMLHSRSTVKRLLHMFGGCTELWTNISAEAEVFAVRQTYGAKADYKSAGREPTDYVNSRLILMWGWSPGDGTFGTGTLQYLKLAKRRGVKIICVDPRRTRTSWELADQHVFINPATDTAALIAMAHVIVTEGLHDQAYLDRHVLGFDEAHLPPGAPAGASYRSYLLGETDGVPKTPEWAAAITGVPAPTLRALAIEYATSKPAALQTGYAPGRTLYGEQFHRAAYALCAMTGNVGIPGGNAGTSNGATGRGGILPLPTGENPAGARVSSPLLADLLERGKAGGYPADVRMIYSCAGDLFNQLPNVRRIIAGVERLDFVVVHDHFVTPTARYADILLPATTFWERNDVGGRRPLRDLHAAGDPSGRRVPERPRHLRGPGRAAGRQGLQRQDRGRVAARADATHHRRLRDVPREGRGPAARPRGRGGLREADSRSGRPPVHDPVGQDRDLLDEPGRPARSLWPRAHPAHPHLDPGADRSAPPAATRDAQVARAHALDPRQPGGARARRP
jgi:anaerobic dimethyl sulfoxide reductase subunit A